MPDRREFFRYAGALVVSSPVLTSLPCVERIGNANLQQTPNFERAAEEHLETYGNCAQASFAILREHYDLDDGEIIRALSPFPGVGLQGDTCGAVTGSIMAMGLMFGRGEGEEYDKFLDVASMARDFCSRFEETLGSTKCGDIHEVHLGRRFDLSDPGEFEEFRATVDGLCSRVVATGVRTALEIVEARKAEA